MLITKEANLYAHSSMSSLRWISGNVNKGTTWNDNGSSHPSDNKINLNDYLRATWLGGFGRTWQHTHFYLLIDLSVFSFIFHPWFSQRFFFIFIFILFSPRIWSHSLFWIVTYVTVFAGIWCASTSCWVIFEHFVFIITYCSLFFSLCIQRFKEIFCGKAHASQKPLKSASS